MLQPGSSGTTGTSAASGTCKLYCMDAHVGGLYQRSIALEVQASTKAGGCPAAPAECTISGCAQTHALTVNIGMKPCSRGVGCVILPTHYEPTQMRRTKRRRRRAGTVRYTQCRGRYTCRGSGRGAVEGRYSAGVALRPMFRRRLK
ncbi:hypothetical protein C8R44DRAFT_856399 [Mycena epipterygia]|nr:hypothetical protein C8R44DRAFT_856399 [Mycena epipterygia]